MTNTNHSRPMVLLEKILRLPMVRQQQQQKQMMWVYRVQLPEIAVAVSTDIILRNHGMHDVIDGEAKAVIDAKVQQYATVGIQSTIDQCKSLKSHLFWIWTSMLGVTLRFSNRMLLNVIWYFFFFFVVVVSVCYCRRRRNDKHKNDTNISVCIESIQRVRIWPIILNNLIAYNHSMLDFIYSVNLNPLISNIEIWWNIRVFEIWHAFRQLRK